MTKSTKQNNAQATEKTQVAEKTQAQKLIEFAEKQNGLCVYENSSYVAIAFQTSEKRKKPIVEIHQSKTRPDWCVIADYGKAYEFAKANKMVNTIAGVVNGVKTWRLCAKIMLNGTIDDKLLFELVKTINGDEKALEMMKKSKIVKNDKAKTTGYKKAEKTDKVEKQQKLA